jgi:PIN domain nuclease of toxin-antitoxin system
MRADAIDGLPVTHAHALHVATLPRRHADPFDRLLVAQAQVEKLTIVTADEQIRRYDVEALFIPG